MPSSNQHRSSSTRPSRSIQNNIRIQPSRSTSVSYRQFTIVLTNNPELLRQTRSHQPLIAQNSRTTNSIQTNVIDQNVNNTNSNDHNREQLLNSLLRLELRDVTRDYIFRTRQPYPLQYVFDMSDIESPHQSSS